jgi:NAD(P)H dehydrogenase (quinone)
VIIVSGANGQLGRKVVERLLERVSAERIGVSVRDPEKAGDLEKWGVRVRRGDFTDPASLAHAFEDATKVLVVSTDTTGEEALDHHRTAVKTAVAAGAERVLYTSHMGSNPSSPFSPMRDHAATEAALRDCGIPFTALRNGFYASTIVRLLGGALQTGELVAPADGPVAWTDHADLAEVTALALAEDCLDGLTPALTGTETTDMSGIAKIANRVSGREIRRVVVSDDEYRAHLISHGVPEFGADMLVGMFVASRHGDFAPADPTLARLLGRPPVTVEDVLKAAQ